MEIVFREIITRCNAGERVALCVIVGARGSTPQEPGAKMLVLSDGRTIGTLGGGCVEAEVRHRALQLLPAGISKRIGFRLDHDYGWDDGLICGGTMDVLVHMLDGETSVEPFVRATDDLAAGRVATIVLPDPEGGPARAYIDEIEPPPRLVIAGAGHVGQALAEIATTLGFLVTVIDDRAECASAERFPRAATCVVGDIEAELRRWPIDPQTYVVIVTRGHRHDGAALWAVLDSPAKYVGLIGSKRKVLTIFGDLLARGASINTLCRIHAPVGLEINAVTVPEIALSIAAELIAVRRGRDDAPAAPMKFDPHRLRELLAKHSATA